jgi:hypothetical protein
MSFETYNIEYVQFIKNFIVNQCYASYNVLLNKKTTCENTHKQLLMDYKNDEDIWKKIMDDNHIPMKYLTFLFKNTKYDMPITNVNVFKQLTFKEYIDSLYTKESWGDNHRQYYSQFWESYNYDYNFKKKMNEKYHYAMYMNVIKNYIIYIIQLYLSKTLDNSKLFSDKEKEEIDIFLDLAVYFEYSRFIDLDSDDEEDDYEEEDYHNYDDEEYFKYLRERPQYKRKTMEEKYNENLEKEMIMLINDSLSNEK